MSGPVPFDFAALAARAQADNPDTLLLDLIQQNRELNKRLRLPRSKVNLAAYQAGCKTWCDQRERIAATPAVTAEGLVAKVRFALIGKATAPGFRLEVAALREALAWIEPPKPRRGRPAKRSAAT